MEGERIFPVFVERQRNVNTMTCRLEEGGQPFLCQTCRCSARLVIDEGSMITRDRTGRREDSPRLSRELNLRRMRGPSKVYALSYAPESGHEHQNVANVLTFREVAGNCISNIVNGRDKVVRIFLRFKRRQRSTNPGTCRLRGRWPASLLAIQASVGRHRRCDG